MRIHNALAKWLLIGTAVALVIPDAMAVRQESHEALEKRREEAYNKGRRLFFEGEFEAAKQKFHEAFMISTLMPSGKPDILSRNYEGLCYQYQDELDHALDIFNHALRLRESLAGTWDGSPQYIADSLNNIGWAFYLKGDYDQALAYLKRAEVIIPKGMVLFAVNALALENLKSVGIPEEIIEKLKLTGGKDCKDEEELLAFLKTIIGDEKVARYRSLFLKHFEYPVVNRTIWYEGRILTNLGAVYMALGDYSKAFKYLRYVVEQSETHNDRMCKTRAFQNLGNLERSWGDQTKALEYYEKAGRVGRDAYDQVYNQAYLVDALSDLGTLYGQMQRFDRAHAIFQEALTISRRLGTRRLMARTLLNLGNLARDQGQLQIAVEYHQQALTVSQEITLRPLMGMALTELGWDSLDSRRPLQRPPHPWPLSTSGEGPGERRGLETAPTQAIQFFQRALDAGGETLAAEVKTRIYSGLAEAYETLNDLKKAAEYYRLTIESIERVRVESLTEDRKIGYWQSKQATFERAVALLHRLRQQDSEADYTAQTFAYAERARARALLDLLAEAKVKPSRGLSPELRQEERAIFQDISRVQKKLLRDDVSQAEKTRLGRGLLKAEERLEEFKQRVRLSHPAYAALQYPQPFTLEKVQREVLGSDTLLLEFMLGEKQSFLWAVSKDESRMVVLPGREEIEQEVNRYRQTITSPPTKRNPFSLYVAPASRLYKMLLRPVEKMLSGYQHVVIAPDGILHYLPFETLVTRREAGRPRFLISDHSISYTSSASALGLLHSERAETSEHGPRLVAYADPLFKTPNKRTKSTKGEIQLVDVTRGLYDQLGMRFDPLPYARVEVKSIAAQFPKAAAQLYLGRAATESSLKHEKLEWFNQIHFATHGLIDEQVPARSGVILSLVGEKQEDGVLQMNEIFDLDLNADLVVLSACQSGLGKVVRGEGMVGLTRAFMYAGADSIVVSLWNVRDSSTAEFMKGFYRHLRQGKPKAEALRHAKLDMLRSNRPAYRHPYFWAPFVLAGKSQ